MSRRPPLLAAALALAVAGCAKTASGVPVVDFSQASGYVAVPFKEDAPAKATKQTAGEPERLFQMLLDKECRACDRLGIRDDLAKPSTYILDRQGNLVYAYVGETSTDRPSVKAILTQLDHAP